MTRHENANVNLTKKCDSRKKNLKDQSSVSNKKKHRHRRHHHKHKIDNNEQVLCDKKVSQDVNKDANGASTLLKKKEDEEDQQQLLPIQINLVLHYHQYLITPIIYKKVKTLFLEKYILEQELEKNKIV